MTASIASPAPETLPPSLATLFTDEEVSQFWRDGFICVPGLVNPQIVAHMRHITDVGLRDVILPVEYEADLHYPGAPMSFEAAGGRTIRRLKQALSRDFLFTEWLMRPEVLGRLQQLLGREIVCPLAHHNCIMTKQPQFSSQTGWHQDIRYWSYAKSELINAWIALGREFPANGCLQVIPGSHRMDFKRSQFDDDVFFRPDHPDNLALIESRQYVSMEPGDVLFFHCRTLHAADRNSTSESKYSAVFTFRGGNNYPIPNSRSSALPELILSSGR
jgi:phytanoyl-CoA hydroxylase